MIEATFTSYQAACDWIDEHTTPDNVGEFIIVQSGLNEWNVIHFDFNATQTALLSA